MATLEAEVHSLLLVACFDGTIYGTLAFFTPAAATVGR